MLRAGHRNLERLLLCLSDALGSDRRSHGEDERREQDAEEEGGQDHAMIANVLEHLLAEHGRDGARHSARSASAARTNASSRSAAPVCSRISSGVPLTTTRPPEMMTMSSQSAETSCITWLENRMHLPDARSSRKSSRSIRTAFTSSPFVGSSKMIVLGRWMSARASATFRSSPCE